MNQDFMVFILEKLPEKVKDGAYVINLGEYADVVPIGLLYFVKEMKLFIFQALVLNMFLNKLKGLSRIKT